MSGNIVSYQLFIGAKGEMIRERDQWKEDFLMEIEDRYSLETLYDTDEYRIIGMPFFSEDTPVNKLFDETLKQKLYLE